MPVRIGNFSGFYGDRHAALAEMVHSDAADVLTGDFLAEVTMNVLSRLRERDSHAGYATTFLTQITPLLGELADSDIRIVVNAGGLNPVGLVEEIRARCAAAGVDLPIAAVLGDDLADRVAESGLLRDPEIGDVSALGWVPTTANAYLGGWGVAAALEAGARIVVGGRITDASVVVGAAAWWHGWKRDQWDQLAGALVAGHVIECGMQVTGGNFSGFADLDLTYPGFPVAEIETDGTCTITKPADTGGAVSVGTVTAQLLYEIQGRWYANPDVLADFRSIRLTQLGPDRVRISGVAGQAPPATTKVALTGPGRWENSMMLGVTGGDLEAKRELVERQLRRNILDLPPIEHLRVETIGSAAADPRTQNEATSFIRIIAQSDDERAVGRDLANRIVGFGLGSYPGRFSLTPPGHARRLGAYRSMYVDQAQLNHRVVCPDGQVIPIPSPSQTSAYSESFDPPSAPGPNDGHERETVPSTLGAVAYARSGDKGDDANVGIWADDDDRWQWLRSWLSTDRLRELLPEADGKRIDRLELPNLRAINFMVRGLLDGGAISSIRLDSQAKGLGEFLRTRSASIPSELLAATPLRHQKGNTTA